MVAEAGNHAVELARRHLPAVALLDIRMPVLVTASIEYGPLETGTPLIVVLGLR